MSLILLVAAMVMTGLSLQEDPVARALPMLTLEACRIGLTPLSRSADFVGTFEYGATVDRQGAIERLSFIRQLGNPPDEVAMRRFVRLDQFESCAQRWRFGAPGQYRITLQGGTMSGGEWWITVSQGARSIRLVVPHPP
jgi:hypothetical protein